VDFQGGRSFVINFHKPVQQDQVKEALKQVLTGTNPEIKTYGGNEQLEITTDYMVNSTAPGTHSIVLATTFQGLKAFLPDGTTYKEFSTPGKYFRGGTKVEPTISDDLKAGA